MVYIKKSQPRFHAFKHYQRDWQVDICPVKGQDSWLDSKATAAKSVEIAGQGIFCCIGEAEPYVVVAIAGRVVVAIRHSAILRAVVPRPAANHTVGA